MNDKITLTITEGVNGRVQIETEFDPPITPEEEQAILGGETRPVVGAALCALGAAKTFLDGLETP